MYTGTYHSKPCHDADLHLVLQRAYNNGIDKLICLAGSIEESKRLLELMDSLENNKMTMSGTILDNDGVNKSRIENIAGSDGTVQVFGTVGVHPTRTAEVFADKIPTSSTDDEGEEGGESFVWRLKSQEQQDEIIQQLIDLVVTNNHKSNNIVAIGECGLDYARLVYSPREIQLVGLRAQLLVARATGLPLYLHNRESGQELYQVLLEHMNDLSSRDDDRSRSASDEDQQTQVRLRGVVHSFDEDIDIANLFLSLGLYIGINGCSLKTAHNLQVVQQLPLNRLILETDCPWCDIRPTHASYQYVQTTFPTLKEKQYSKELEKEKYCVKNRTEPCHVVQVAEVIAALHGVDVQEVALVCRQNVLDLFENIGKSSRWCSAQP
jgi:TatD DNase family protein